MERYKKVYIFLGCFLGMLVLGIVVIFLRWNSNAQPSRHISVSAFQQDLNRNKQVIATVGNESYQIDNLKELQSVLDFALWEGTNKQKVKGDALFSLEVDEQQIYTFYVDGYIHAYTNVIEKLPYNVNVADETQYRIPAELAQDILAYLEKQHDKPSADLADDGEVDPETPTPDGGVDPNAEQEPADRAAAFLANADVTYYEAAAILYKGNYIVPVVEYVPTSQYMEYGHDHTQWILDLLHGFDLSTMEQVQVPGQQEGIWHNTTVIGVGDAACRMTFWYEKMPAEDPSVRTIVVFTFSDGSACAFDGGARNEKCADLAMVDQLTRSGYAYTLMGGGGNMTVTQVQTGDSQVASPHMSGVGRAILDAAAQYGETEPDTAGNFDRRVEFADGAVWLLDLERLLAKGAGGQVYSLEGFEDYDKMDLAAVFQLPGN